MKVSGITFIRNAIQLDYPIAEAIDSIESLCDEIIVAVGDSDDETLALVQAIENDKVKILRTAWDFSKNKGTNILTAECNKALAAVSPDSDWIIYIQADEILHEKGRQEIKKALLKYQHIYTVDAIAVNFKHFFHSYFYTAESPKWYIEEVRIIKNKRNIVSWQKAQSFRKKGGQKLLAAKCDATYCHFSTIKQAHSFAAVWKNTLKIWHNNLFKRLYLQFYKKNQEAPIVRVILQEERLPVSIVVRSCSGGSEKRVNPIVYRHTTYDMRGTTFMNPNKPWRQSRNYILYKD